MYYGCLWKKLWKLASLSQRCFFCDVSKYSKQLFAIAVADSYFCFVKLYQNLFKRNYNLSNINFINITDILQRYSKQQPVWKPASLAKWLSVHLQTNWLWVRVSLQSLNLQISRLLRARNSLTFRQLQSVDWL